ELADYIVERLQGYGVRFLDEADLYHADNGRYIVEDQNSCVVDVVRSKAEWHRQHRRIFARVKNAKTKPIERFFSTLEQILQDMKLPGYIKELGLSAPEEEQAQKRLDWQRRNGYVLTYDEFIAKVLEAVKIYENRRHGTLGCSPRERLAEYERNGWQPVFIDPRDEAYLFMERAFATVRGDRVQLAGREYIGPDLTQEMVLENRSSLVAYSGRKIELRFDPDNLDAGVFAIEPDTSRAIALRPAEKIDMLDHDDLSRQLAWKKRNMAAVSSAFEAITKDKTVRVLSDGGAFRELRRAEELAARPETPASGGAPETHHSRPAESRKSMERTEIPSALRTSGTELSDGEFWSGVAERISRENIVRTHGKKVFLTERERYQDLLERLLDGDRISGEDMAFKNRYEAKMTDQEKAYARAIIRQNTQEE
ncbi:MAG: Mu transposase C-terminal domain-containing protein, partial [Treponemataceae bacterium]|nr:Mu transposase C-terminal domain-containing protein [Treponemataceae bacterium]